MRARLQVLHFWQQELHAIAVGVRATQTAALGLLVWGILLAGSVTLPKVAAVLPGDTVSESRVRRLRRFLANPLVEVAQLWPPLRRALLAEFAGRAITLVFDPTPRAGHTTVLTLSVAQHKRALPIVWTLVPQQTTWDDSLDGLLAPMLEAVAADLPPGCTVTLLTDRGITGPAIIRRCQKLGWHWTLRLNTGACQTHRVRVADEEHHLWSWLETQDFRVCGPVELFKGEGWLPMELTVIWDRRYREPWILISDAPAGHARVVEYRRRTHIEATFQDSKSRGFDVERTKITAHDRLDRLILALALALWWGTQLGLRVIRSGRRRAYDRTDRRDKSVLRLGCEELHHRLLRDRLPPLPFSYHHGIWRYVCYA